MSVIANLVKKNYIYVICFIFPIIVFLISMKIAEISPFGNNPITIYDGYHQYPGIASYYSNVLRGTESLLYSFKGGLGMNFYAIAVYYLFNPTSILLFLFNNENINIYYEIMIVLKIGLCGLSFSILLNYLKYKKTTIFLFSSAYALCAYNVLYFSNYMWIDSLFLFPLIIIGINRLIYENKKLMYLITLSITIISNFYIGYMICIFILIYFIYKYMLLDKNSRRKGLIKDFIVLSFLSGLISCFALIPVVLELFMGKNTLYTRNSRNYFRFDNDILTMFYKLSPNSFSSKDISYGTPNIYCSLLCLVYVIFSFFNKNLPKKEKILNFIIILYFASSLSFNLLDFSWQLFQKPIWYPVRYAFIIDAFLILIAAKAFDSKDKIKIKKLYEYLIIILLFELIMLGEIIINKYAFYPNLKIITLSLTFVLIVEYILTVQKKHRIFDIFIIIVFVLEITFNSVASFKNLAVSSSEDYEEITIKHYNAIVNIMKTNDTSFYRSDFYKRHHFNNALLFDYNGINFFSSVRNKNAISFLDYYVDTTVYDGCSILYNFYNPVLNNILGVKYLIGTDEAMYYTLAFQHNSSIYVNKDAFSLGYLVNDKIYETELVRNNYNQNLENIASSMIGYDIDLYQDVEYELYNAKLKNNIVLTPLSSEQGTITYKSSNKKGFFVLNSYAFSVIKSLKINGTEIESPATMATSLFLNESDSLELTLNINKKIDISKLGLVFVPYDKYIEFVNNIKQDEMIISNYEKDDHINATLVSTIDKNVLFTTIPYDKGWKIYVDGKLYKYESVLDNAFISLKLSPGEHYIEFDYTPRGLVVGIYLSVTGIIGSIAYIIYERKKSAQIKNQ